MNKIGPGLNLLCMSPFLFFMYFSMAVVVFMEGHTTCINVKHFSVLIGMVIDANLGIYSMLHLKNCSFLQPKTMERLLTSLPSTFAEVVNGVWFGEGAQHKRGRFQLRFKNSSEAIWEMTRWDWEMPPKGPSR